MEEERLSVISSGRANANLDVSDSNSTTRHANKRQRDDSDSISTDHHANKRQKDALDSISIAHHANKRQKDDSDLISTVHHANNRQRCGSKANSSQFKGVMRQKNGQWGAQIYANHMRIWLGTFKSEKDAAMAYDTAAIKYRTGDTHRNFPWNEITIEEPKFLSQYSDEAVLGMIRDGSYQYKLLDFIKARSRSAKVLDIDLNLMGIYSKAGVICKQMFQKKLTPSDVGKLNRLVIPKKFAVEYFPPVTGIGKENAADNVDDQTTNHVHLEFRDKFMRRWEFRYCYWNSSQSFVFTRGWNRFLKENKLKANDVISFFRCELREGNEVRTFCLIDANISGNGCSGAALVKANNDSCVGRELVDLQLRLGHCDGEKQEQAPKAAPKAVPNAEHDVKTEGFKLFGMKINVS